jgi:hypothetical protein
MREPEEGGKYNFRLPQDLSFRYHKARLYRKVPRWVMAQQLIATFRVVVAYAELSEAERNSSTISPAKIVPKSPSNTTPTTTDSTIPKEVPDKADKGDPGNRIEYKHSLGAEPSAKQTADPTISESNQEEPQDKEISFEDFNEMNLADRARLLELGYKVIPSRPKKEDYAAV